MLVAFISPVKFSKIVFCRDRAAFESVSVEYTKRISSLSATDQFTMKKSDFKWFAATDRKANLLQEENASQQTFSKV